MSHVYPYVIAHYIAVLAVDHRFDPVAIAVIVIAAITVPGQGHRAVVCFMALSILLPPNGTCARPGALSPSERRAALQVKICSSYCS